MCVQEHLIISQYMAIELHRFFYVSNTNCHLCEALQASIEIRDVCMLMYALPVAALLLFDRGQLERAIEIYALASCYPFVARSTWFEAVIGQEIAAAAEALAPQVVAEARVRGRTRDLWATVEELLDELAESGSQRETG